MARKTLKGIIKESVRSAFGKDYDKWEEVKDVVGCETMISELYNWLSADEIDEFLEYLDRNYDINLYGDDDEEGQP